MERMAADAVYARLHEARPWHDGTFQEWAERPSDEHPYHFTYGVTVGMADSDLRPWDAFLTDEAASPSASSDHEVHEDDDDRDSDQGSD